MTKLIETIRIQAGPDNFILAARAAKYVVDNPEMGIGFRNGHLLEYGEGKSAVQFYTWRNKRSIGVRQVKP